MDDTDRRLIALLRENARLPVATPAHLLKVSRGTVQNRIGRLTADGVISGFTVRLKPEAEPQRVRAITMVAVDGEYDVGSGFRVAARSNQRREALANLDGGFKNVRGRIQTLNTTALCLVDRPA